MCCYWKDAESIVNNAFNLTKRKPGMISYCRKKKCMFSKVIDLSKGLV